MREFALSSTVNANESGLYYLQSRYYDPDTGRFINADNYTSTGTGLLGYNMFAYCKNNPVNMQDSCGNKPGDLFAEEIDAIRDAAIYIGALSFETGWEYSTAIYTVTIEKYIPKKVIEYIFRGNGTASKRISIVWIRQTAIRYKYGTILTDEDPYSVRIPRAPEGRTRVAVIHTHPMGSNKGITKFSPQDITNTDTIYKCPLYVYGPNGKLLKYDPSQGVIIPIFDDLPVSEKQPWLD